MNMSNFIDEEERHAELYGAYTPRRKWVLAMVQKTDLKNKSEQGIRSSLYSKGISPVEVQWLKRTGHIFPMIY